MVARVITIAQQKGGAGKTTLAAHLAVAWARGGHRVIAIDIDPQLSLATWFERRRRLFGGGTLNPMVVQISGWRVRSEIERAVRNNDIIVIDSPPHMEIEARTAVRVADLVVVPVQPSPMDVWATRPTLGLIKDERRRALLVLNRIPSRARLTAQMEAEVMALGVAIAQTQIGNRIVYAAALAEGLTALDAAPDSSAGLEMQALADEILRLAS
jgi:chromosome partitioning protein